MRALPTILVVDDDRDTADSLTMLLKSAGYAAEATYDARSALAFARETRPSLVFLDLAMPKMHGFGLAKELRELPGMADAMLVCFTGYTGAEYEQKAMESGCNRFIIKPAEPAEILDIARQVAETGKISDARCNGDA